MPVPHLSMAMVKRGACRVGMRRSRKAGEDIASDRCQRCCRKRERKVKALEFTDFRMSHPIQGQDRGSLGFAEDPE